MTARAEKLAPGAPPLCAEVFEQLLEVLPPFIRTTTDREDVAAIVVLTKWRDALRAEATAAEREACALAVEDESRCYKCGSDDPIRSAAAGVRARGAK